MPPSPIAISCSDIEPIIFRATARITKDLANEEIAFADCFNSFSLGSAQITPTIAPKATTMPPSPIAISCSDIDPIIFRATDIINRAVAIPFIAEAITTIFAKLLASPSILLNRLIAPNNSVNITVIAPNEAVSLLESISDITNSDAASIAIAVAISLSVFAFSCWVNASKASPTPPTISLIFSKIPPVLSSISPPFLINLAMNIPIAENMPPFNKSKRPL